ncbi:eukaryotic peptide chain release factor GTP-binding subunit ERF3A [Phthorimaea operculella]|nr:eukaryotic peptide chain release factor GTP-binding subunit ERF3A [Phthorimaea operculella]
MLAKTAGVKHLVALVNKMDDPTVNWDEKRYNECRDKILPYLKKLGFNPAKDLSFLPVSGQTGQGLLTQVSEDVCPWYRGPSFIQLIDDLPSLNRKVDGPFIMPVVDKYKDMGTVLMGKVEAGTTRKGSTLLLMPNRVQVTVDQLWSDDIEVTSIGPGENVKVKLKGIEEEDVSPGFVLCDVTDHITTGKIFDAQVVILEHKSIICAGYSAVMHIHCAAEEVTVKALICLVDKKTGEKSKTRPRFVKQDQVAIMRIECAGVICLEPFKKFAQMGRFTLRDEIYSPTTLHMMLYMMRIECAGVICLEPFKKFAQMGRFTLRDESTYLYSIQPYYTTHDAIHDEDRVRRRHLPRALQEVRADGTLHAQRRVRIYTVYSPTTLHMMLYMMRIECAGVICLEPFKKRRWDASESTYLYSIQPYYTTHDAIHDEDRVRRRHLPRALQEVRADGTLHAQRRE